MQGAFPVKVDKLDVSVDRKMPSYQPQPFLCASNVKTRKELLKNRAPSHVLHATFGQARKFVECTDTLTSSAM